MNQIQDTINKYKKDVHNHQDFYNKKLNNGQTMKQTLDDIIYGENEHKRGCTYGFFAARAY